MNSVLEDKSGGSRTHRVSRISSFSIALALAAIAIYSLQSCSHGPGHLVTDLNAPSVVMVAIDSSTSNIKFVPEELEDIGSLALRLDSDSTFMDIWKYAYEPEEVYSDFPPNSDEELLQELTPKFALRSRHDLTFINKVMVKIADRAEKCSGRVVVILAGDGFGEGMSADDHAAVTKAAASLALNTHVEALFIEGVDSQNMAQMRHDLAPLGGKMKPVSLGKLDASLVASLVAGSGK